MMRLGIDCKVQNNKVWSC